MVLLIIKMKEKCVECGMIRSTKDLVNLENRSYVCFHCWNTMLKEKNIKDKTS